MGAQPVRHPGDYVTHALYAGTFHASTLLAGTDHGPERWRRQLLTQLIRRHRRDYFDVFTPAMTASSRPGNLASISTRRRVASLR